MVWDVSWGGLGRAWETVWPMGQTAWETVWDLVWELETAGNSWKQLFRGVRRPFFRVFLVHLEPFGLQVPWAQIWAQTGPRTV